MTISVNDRVLYRSVHDGLKAGTVLRLETMPHAILGSHLLAVVGWDDGYVYRMAVGFLVPEDGPRVLHCIDDEDPHYHRSAQEARECQEEFEAVRAEHLAEVYADLYYA